jgi:nicotinamidase/pyrazinamidase
MDPAAPDRYGRSTALLVVDVQNDFADPSGSLYVAGGEDVVEVANNEIARAIDAHAFVAYTQDWHPSVTPHFVTSGGVWPVHCVGGSWGSDLHPGLRVAGERVRKGTGGEDGYSGFTVRDPASGQQAPTVLEAMLRNRGINNVVIVGLATDYCVKDTALDAVQLGFVTIVLRAGIRAVDLAEGDGQRAIKTMARAGVAFA